MTSNTYDELHMTLKKLEEAKVREDMRILSIRLINESQKSEDHSLRVAIWNILTGWEELQSIRQNQGFRSTAVTLHVRDDEIRLLSNQESETSPLEVT